MISRPVKVSEVVKSIKRISNMTIKSVFKAVFIRFVKWLNKVSTQAKRHFKGINRNVSRIIRHGEG